MTGAPKPPPGGWSVYVLRFLTYSTWGVLYPFFTVWLLRGGLFTAAECGLITGAAVLANRLGSLAFVRVLRPGSERRFVICSQVAMAAASGVMYVMGILTIRSMVGWLLVSVAFGLASSLATLAQLTLIVHQFDAAQTRRAFSYENIALNAAGGLAPLVSSLAYTASRDLYVLAPIGFAVASALLATRLSRGGAPPSVEPGTAPGGSLLGPGAVILLVVNFLTTLTYAQFYGVFTTYATPELGPHRVGLLFAFSSVAIVLMQSLITRWSRGANELALVVISNLAMAVGTALLIAPEGGMPLMLLAIASIAIGEMIYVPIYQTMAVGISRGRPAVAIGALTFVWGLAESLAVAVGLWLIGTGLGMASFLAGAGAAVAVVVLVAVFHRRFTAMTSTASAVPPIRPPTQRPRDPGGNPWNPHQTELGAQSPRRGESAS